MALRYNATKATKLFGQLNSALESQKMSYKIFDLKDTSVEEERFVKKHLRMHRIKFHETPKGSHSNPAIWVKTAQLEYKAKKVLNKCQKKWRENVK